MIETQIKHQTMVRNLMKTNSSRGCLMLARLPLAMLGFLLVCPLATAQPRPKGKPKEPADVKIRIPDFTPLHAPAMVFAALDDRMALTKLKEAIYVPDLCLYRYRVGTTSAECQKFVDQSMGYFYSYVWIEAARSAETALKHDPNCAYAWLMLSKGLDKWGRSAEATTALKKAQELMPKAPHREQMLISAKLLEKGITGSATTPDERKKATAKALDDMLVIYDDDEEAWFAHAVLLGGFQGSNSEGVPFYKALLKINPVHPGANHELVHFYENTRRPAIGWPYAEGYIASSPGIPHAFHMQAHLATRIGKWDKTADRSWKAVELEREYHKAQGVNHSEDHQFSHHLETLVLALLHDGRYADAEKIKAECGKYGYKFPMLWFRLAVSQHRWEEAETMVANERKGDKTQASYMAALMSLERGDTAKATAEVDILRLAQQNKKGDRRLEQRLWETQGRLMCQTGSGEAGLKLLQRTVEKTKDDYQHHAWGGGAYHMENWGMSALETGKWDVAEEAFLEALAHDPGSVRGSLGMQIICEKQGRTEEAKRFAALGQRLWAKADVKDLASLREHIIHLAGKSTAGVAAAGSE